MISHSEVAPATSRFARCSWFWALAPLAFVMLGARPASAECDIVEPRTGISMSVADGQLTSAPFRIFVDAVVSEADKPRLQLRAARAVTSGLAGENSLLEPMLVAPRQAALVTVGGQAVPRCGTLLLFDLRSFPIDWYKPMRRVEPVLSWQPLGAAGAPMVRALGPRVNIGQPVQAWLWTLLVVLLTVAVIADMSTSYSRIGRVVRGSLGRIGLSSPSPKPKPLERPPYCLLCVEDGHLSLAKVQLTLWALAIGTAVFFYGLIRVNVPSVPDTLVVLMGLSLVTGGFSYVADRSAAARTSRATDPPAAPGAAPPIPVSPAAPPVVPVAPRLSDLICEFAVGKPRELSISRAQMLFWTAILAILFVSKSTLEGTLWDVPVQLVALTGISQLGYVAPKFIPTAVPKPDQ